ncbi:MAG: 2-oxo acid dehydrogenase subunit E2 [Pirellulales bacterium]|nr:2-oxo acid dehydrogenase subunit E2 [Pirellulales bacterium]
MHYEVTVPRLGWSMDEGTFVGWLKRDGEMVQPGEPLFELESDKATQPIEALDPGVLRIPPDAPQPGDVVPVGKVLAYLVDAVSAAGFVFPGSQVVTASVTADAAPVSARSAPAAAPSVRRLARSLGVSLADVGSEQNSPRVTADDVRAAATVVPAPKALPHDESSAGSAFASPRARRVAQELGVDWRKLRGTGRQGRVRERDVRQATEADARNAAAAASSLAAPTPAPAPVLGISPAPLPTTGLSPRRRTIAARMLASSQQTAPVTLTTRADATNLVALREQFRAAGQDRIPSFTVIIARLSASVLRQHPPLASRWDEQGITVATDMHLGLAVDTDAGLLVPVLRDVDRRSLLDLALESQQLFEAARAGRLTAEQMQGGVFTISNLGAYGIDAFTPIIHQPQAAILGLGAIRDEPTVRSGQVVVRAQMTLSLTFDHRLLDGAPAARALQTLVSAIENPAAWLLS